MDRRTTTALTLFVGASLAVCTWAGADAPSADDVREKQIADRFLGVLEKTPRRGTALDRLYGYHVERGSLDALVKSFAARTEKDAKDGVAWMIIGLLEAQRGKDAAAVAAFEKAESARPDDPLASYYRGQSFVLIGQPDNAAQAFERAIARKPNRNDLLDIFQALGRVYQRAQQPEKALAVWARLEQAIPDDLRVQEQIATTLAEEGQFEQALPRYERLAKAVKDPYRQATFRMEAAELKVRLKRAPQALADFEKLLDELNPDNWLYRDVRRKIDEVFLRNDDQAGLTRYYEDWLKKKPDDLEAMTRLARALAVQGRMPESKSWLEKALAKAPSRRDLRQSMIDQLVYEQKYAEAIAHYEALDKSDPGNPDALRDWGKLLMRDGGRPETERKAAATAVWKRLLERRPKDPVVAAQVADLFRAANLSDDAIALYRKAVELAPASAQYREYLGEYLHVLKRSDEALVAWRPIAAGENRNAKNLARLAEVLGGFGYRKEAIAAQADAVSLEKDDFNLVHKYADLLEQDEQHDRSLAQLDAAAKLAASDEDRESVLLAQIKVYQATDSLARRTESLKKELDGGTDATADRWHRLARYYDASRSTAEATAAILKALEKDPKSVAVLTTAARLHETGGNLLAAAEANRKLAAIDRRLRTEYLQRIAQLEARLGRIAEATQAGRDLLAAAPGNPDHYKFFAELCFQLGEADEGLESLRRSVRANPGDPQGLMTLAQALAERFRGGEAVELLWRAFDKSNDLEGKLGVIGRLTELYLQTNQFDKLFERLERERREADKQRELTMCIAQAYQAAGDLGAARRELERLLGENAKDVQLLGQLANLAENEGDVATAVKYQRQLEKASPSNRDARLKLAQLLVRAGESDEAAAIWVELVAGEPEPARNLQAIDQLIGAGRAETALSVLSRLLAQKPGDWELLYREGVALAATEKRADAARRFQGILDLRAPDDELSTIVKFRKKQRPGRPAGAALGAVPQFERHPLESRVQAAYTIRGITGLEPRSGYFLQQNRTWPPDDYGQARLAAIGWLFAFATRDGTADAFVKQWKDATEKVGVNPRSQMDWFYLQVVRQNYTESFEAAKTLAAAGDTSGAWLYLNSLGTRTLGGQRVARRSNRPDATPPLPAAELDLVVQSYRRVRQQKPDWLAGAVVGNVLKELKRANRPDDEAALFDDAVSAARQPMNIQFMLAVAADRGDTKVALELLDRLDKLPVSAAKGNSPQVRQAVSALGHLVSKRAEAKAPADSVRVFDAYFAMHRRLRGQAAGKPSATNPQQSQSRYVFMSSQGFYRQMVIDWPLPNDYFDSGSIQLLRQTFEAYKSADLVSDLFAIMQKKSDAAPPGEKIDCRLALSYLNWWNQDKDKALAEFQSASALAPGDVSLKFELANLRERNGEPDEALASLDTIQPTDPTVMQRRETSALRLATRLGHVERARLAADRLFGLRLDAEKQIELAAQMHRLGMHAAAESVLARAQRQAGNRSNALVSLMNQYLTQNQPDLAVQIARQLLRKGPSMNLSPYRGDAGDGREEAISVLARSGKLSDLTERAEAQLKASPKSLPLHQTLLDYYKAANEKEKIKATAIKMAELKPDDGKLRYQLAQQLAQAGEPGMAADQYAAALRKEPSLFSNNYWEIQQTFAQAKKSDDLLKVLDDVDMRQFAGNYYAVLNAIQPLFAQEKTRDQAMRMFRKCWEAFPEYRQYMLQYIQDDNVWRMPEIYGFLCEAVIPSGDTLADPWLASEDIIQYAGDGRVVGLFTRAFDVARKQRKLDVLAKDVEAALMKHPTWKSGRAFLAVLHAHLGRMDDARKGWDELLADSKNPMPPLARFIFGQELEDFSALREQVIKSYAAGADDMLKDYNMDLSYNPVRRLIAAHIRDERRAEARHVIQRALNTSVFEYEPGFGAYRKIANGIECAKMYVQMDSPVDALKLYSSLLEDGESLEAAARIYGEDRMRQQVEQNLQRTIKSINPAILASSVRELLQPAESAKSLDLMLIVPEKDLAKTNITSVVATAIREGAKTPENRAALIAQTAELTVQRPADMSTAIVAALVALTDEKPEKAADAIDRLVKLIDDNALESLPAGAKANARQRVAARLQIGLWLAAREAMRREPLRASGEKLGERALAAARRQLDTTYSLAILREWGQIDHDRGDKPAAQRRWAQMLEIVLPTPPVPKKVSSAVPAAGVALLTVALVQPSTPTVAFVSPSLVPVATIEQFDRAMQIANLALDQHLPALSLQAVRESLRGGPPVPVQQNIDDGSGMRRLTAMSSGSIDSASPYVAQVYSGVSRIAGKWKQAGIPAAERFEALAALVLPEGRPAEVFAYPQAGGEYAESLGRLLAEAAAEAGRLDELVKRAEARQNQPLGELTARILLAHAARTGKDSARAAALFEWFDQRLQKDTLQTTAELVSHAALPALDEPALEPAAMKLLEQAAANLANAKSDNRSQAIRIQLARRYFARNRPESGRDLLKLVSAAALKRVVRGNIGVQLELQTVAVEYIRAGLPADALDLMAHVADLPPNQRHLVPADAMGATILGLAHALAKRPAAARYEILKAWSLPAENRKSVRILAAFVSNEMPPPAFQAATVPSDGVVSTANLLVDAAKQAGKLDELMGALKAATDAKIENAELLLILSQLAAGRASDAELGIRAWTKNAVERAAKPDLPSNTPGYSNPSRENDDPTIRIQWADFLLARACLAEPSLTVQGHALCDALMALAKRNRSRAFIQHIRYAAAADRVSRAQLGDGSGLALWHPANTTSAVKAATTLLPARWIAHEEYVAHLCGPERGFLLFDWPLTGTFSFRVDAFQGSFAEGHASYAGLVLEPNFRSSPSRIATVGFEDQAALRSVASRTDNFNTLTIDVSPGKVRCLVNDRLFSEDTEPSPSSPWLALFAHHDRHAVYRNLKLSGSPTIPREVRLVDRDRLDGWHCPLGGSMPTRLRKLSESDDEIEYDEVSGRYRRIERPTEFDWQVRDGVIEGRRLESATNSPVRRPLSYFRPLRPGETLRYEFLHEAGKTHVDPCLGRVAFLLDPAGVKLHWLGVKENDPSGLKPDNAIELPAQRRGTPLLKAGDWNTMTLRMGHASVTLDLNGTPIYELPLGPDDARTFGLCHDPNKTAARVRNIVLTGNWPEQLDAATLKNLLAREPNQPVTPAALSERRAAIGEAFLWRNAGPLLAASRELPIAERYDRLAAWVLPAQGKSSFQFAGEFAPTDPIGAKRESAPRQMVGGELESPALELVKTAKAAGRLDELAQLVEALTGDNVGRSAMLALVRSAQGNGPAAAELLGRLALESSERPSNAPSWRRWAELTAAAGSHADPTSRGAATALLDAEIRNLERAAAEKALPGDAEDWLHRLRHLRARLKTGGRTFGVDPGLANWFAASEVRSSARGKGSPPALWTIDDGAIRHHPGHSNDYLYLRTPLRGDFEFRGELTSGLGREIHPGVGGVRFEFAADLKSIDVFGFDRKVASTKLDPPIAAADWLPFRLVASRGVLTAYVGDRKLCEEPLPSYSDPWVWIHAPRGSAGAVRNLAITGTTNVPESVILTATPDLSSWGLYEGGMMLLSMGSTARYDDNGPWQKRGEEIIAGGGRPKASRAAKPDPPRTWHESTLFYHRPLVEDGSVEYEFFYHPGKTLTHPAFDRLCLLLEPNGVRVHWLTDGGDDRSGIGPDNVTDEPQHRRGPAELPLKEKAWNTVAMTINGDTLTLSLNGTVVFERPIEPSNQRTFGLFHYVDDTAVRVRNVLMNSSWPKSLPSANELLSAAGKR